MLGNSNVNLPIFLAIRYLPREIERSLSLIPNISCAQIYLKLKDGDRFLLVLASAFLKDFHAYASSIFYHLLFVLLVV